MRGMDDRHGSVAARTALAPRDPRDRARPPRRRRIGRGRARDRGRRLGTRRNELAGAVVWRGLFYGAVDGLLLTAFPIIVVFAALSESRLRRRKRGFAAVAAIALAASLAFTATYHLGYSDFRSAKLRKPVAGDLIWAAPVIATANPIGAPIAHAGLHVAAVTHSYDTELFLPPH